MSESHVDIAENGNVSYKILDCEQTQQIKAASAESVCEVERCTIMLTHIY